SAHARREIDEDGRLGRARAGVRRLGPTGQVEMTTGASQLPEGGVAGDAHGPRLERPAAGVEAAGVAPHALEGLLHDVVGPGGARAACWPARRPPARARPAPGP